MDDKIKKKSKMVWSLSPAGSTFAKSFYPGSKEFFSQVLEKRSKYEQPWLYELVPFMEFSSKKILELGCGVGYDAYNFCLNGADYIGIDIAPTNPRHVIDHLSFFDLHPKVVVGDVEKLMFPNEYFDVIYSNGVLHHTPDLISSLREANRVLKLGGEFWTIIYNRNSVYYWLTFFLRDYILKLNFLKRSLKDQRSLIEFTISNEKPLVNVYSRHELKSIIKESGFSIEKIWIRKLVAEDLPFYEFSRRLPTSLLNFISKYAGWYIIVKSKKERI